MMFCLLLLISIKESLVLMSQDKSRKRTYRSYSFLPRLPIMKSHVKALFLYNPQNLSSLKRLMVLLKSSSKRRNFHFSTRNLFLLHLDDATSSQSSYSICIILL
ncbi:hypothetical protein NC651_003252 [Populus alba x Populus x berolinensis]|nr:hypothetical protein NC651_003252 [Populus alba x Populus x berolinensis]